MTKQLPLYALLTLILVSFVTFGGLLLRKANAIESELADIRMLQMKRPKGPLTLPTEATPVWVMNIAPLKVEVER